MSKKILIPVIIALILALGLGSVAYAANSNSKATLDPISDTQVQNVKAKLQRAVGKVTSVGSSEFTLQTKRGEITVKVTGDTQYRDVNGQPLSFSDLKTGLWVIGRGEKAGKSGQAIAKLVVIFPEGVDLSQVQARLAGEVTAVDAAGNSFTLHTLKGEDRTIQVSGSTVYAGSLKSFSDLRVGQRVAVAASDSSGELTAILVAARINERFAGTVTAVDANTFTLHTKNGEAKTFTVNDQTQFGGPKLAIKSFSELKVGMLAGVAAKEDNGSLVAVRVVAGNKPKFDVKVAGKVVSKDDNSFTMRNRKGEQLTFKVTGETRFISRDGSVKSLADLQPGMVVLVGAKKVGSDEYQALVVAAPKK